MTTALASHAPHGAEVIRALGSLPPFEKALPKNRLELGLHRWCINLVTAIGIIFTVLAIVLGIQQMVPFAPSVNGTIRLVAALMLALALLLVVMVTLSGVIGAVQLYLNTDVSYQEEYLHDLRAAQDLVQKFSPQALEWAAQWIGQKIQRMEQRQFRLIGGPDKLALVALIGAGLTMLKELTPQSLATTPSTVVIVAAAVAGLMANGVLSALQQDQLRRQRDLLQLTRSVSTSP